MNNHTISIPHALYEKAQRIAQRTSRQVDDVIRTRLEGAFEEPLFDLTAEEQAELQAIAYLSDDILWTIARKQMPAALQERTSTLLTKNQRGTITEAEYAELEALVERGDRLTLLKSEAMKHLAERGHSISLDDLKPADE